MRMAIRFGHGKNANVSFIQFNVFELEVDCIYKLAIGFQMPPFWLLVLKVNEDAVVTYYFHCRYEELLQWRQLH